MTATPARHLPHILAPVLFAVGKGRPLREALADVPGATAQLVADIGAALSEAQEAAA